ncbi:MAG: hypothetical protein KDB07_06245 [Planctomycetes bacterium]|nr:hypothetical protein [Planctomycetota bacterium]
MAEKKKKTPKTSKAKAKPPPVEKTPVLTRKQEAIALLQKELDARYGAGTLRTAANVPDTFSLRRPTGIPSLDLLLKGGFPAGGMAQIIGEDGAGKTDISWRTLAQGQLNYGDEFAGALVSVEKVDKSQGRFAGAHIEYTPEEMQEILDDGVDLPAEELVELTRPGNIYAPFPYGTDGSAEMVLNLVLDLYASRQFQIIVLDSVAALAPRAVLEKNVSEDARVAALAGKLTMFMQKFWTIGMQLDNKGRPNETTLIVLNQFREEVNLSNPKADKLRIMGGRAMKHGKLVDLYLMKGGSIYSDDAEDVIGAATKRKVLLGRAITAKILKGKAGLHDGPTCQWRYLHALGIDIPDSFVSLWKYYSDSPLLADIGYEIRGANYYIGGVRHQGKENAALAFQQNPELALPLMEAFYKIERVPKFRVV